MKKVLYLGKAPLYKGDTALYSVYLKAEINEKGILSISGVHGPLANGDCKGSAGQMYDVLPTIKEYAEGWNAAKVEELYAIWKKWHLNDMHSECEHQREDTSFMAELERNIVKLEYWYTSDASTERVELKNRCVDSVLSNSSMTLTEHQRKVLSKPKYADAYITEEEYLKDKEAAVVINNPDATLYETHLSILRNSVEIQTARWVRYENTPLGCLCRPCPVCGYEYGSKWNFVELPQKVVDWFNTLPESKVTPAWI